ncbi:MAG: hypothetical protein GOV02_03590 [Candidatus Aenigmarchaeota archaeon]|nr:hypothetical protein [Candidatus Aenigmarchaeota archaeon]
MVDRDDALFEVASRPKANLSKFDYKKEIIAEYGIFDENGKLNRDATLDNARYHAWMEFCDVYNTSLIRDFEYLSISENARIRTLLVHTYLNPKINPRSLPDGHMVNMLGGVEKVREYASYAKYYIQDHDIDEERYKIEKHWTKLPMEELMADVPDDMLKHIKHRNLGSDI